MLVLIAFFVCMATCRTGRFPSTALEIDVPIGPVEYEGVKGGVHAANQEGKPARSVARAIHVDTAANTSIVEVRFGL